MRVRLTVVCRPRRVRLQQRPWISPQKPRCLLLNLNLRAEAYEINNNPHRRFFLAISGRTCWCDLADLLTTNAPPARSYQSGL